MVRKERAVKDLKQEHELAHMHEVKRLHEEAEGARRDRDEIKAYLDNSIRVRGFPEHGALEGRGEEGAGEGRSRGRVGYSTVMSFLGGSTD